MKGRFRSLRKHIEGQAGGQTGPGLAERLGGKVLPITRILRGKIAVQRFLMAILATAVLGTALYWYAGSAPEVKVPVIFEVEHGDFTMKISELGELRALNSVAISAQIDVPIIHLVPEGTTVKKGDLLVRFDPSKYQVALEESKTGLQLAQAELQKAGRDLEAQRQRLLAEIGRFEAEVRLAQLDLDNLKGKPLQEELERARLELEKAEVAFGNAEKRRHLLRELVQEGVIAKSALEEAEFKYLEAKVALQAARANFEKVSAGATAEELEKGKIRFEQAKFALEKAKSAMSAQLQSVEASVEREKANVERARNLIEKAQVRLNRTELRAPRQGLVVYAKAGGEKSSEKMQLGMIPFEGQPILYLPDLSTMVVDTEVNEVDIGKVEVGGPVEVRLESYPGTVFHGKVNKIGSLAKLKQSRSGTASGIKVFDVTVQIEGKDSRLKPGLTATLDIIVDRRQDVISIPLSAVVSRRGEHVVFVSSAGKVVERKVILGPSNERSVIVEEGLRPGENVILGHPAAGSP